MNFLSKLLTTILRPDLVSDSRTSRNVKISSSFQHSAPISKLSSVMDEIDENSSKDDILAAVLAGKKIHKISPAFPKNWTADEIEKMAEFVHKTGQKQREAAEKTSLEIPAVNYRNEPLSGGLLQWVNLVRLNRKLKYNRLIERGGRIRPGGRTNRQLWKEVSRILLAEYQYWSLKLKSNRQLMAEGRGYLVEYPKIGNLPFRDNSTFLGGEWSHFREFWNTFIDEMNDDPDCRMKSEVRESLEHGVDIISFSRPISRDDPLKYREPVHGPPVYLYTKPVRNKLYTRKRLGRRDYTDPHNTDENSIIGYYPVIKTSRAETDLDVFHQPTSRKNLSYAHVFASQFLSWIKTGCIRPGVKIDADTRLKDHAEIFLPIQIEAKKPRVCVDGSAPGKAGPHDRRREELPCVLDDNRLVVTSLKKDDYLSVVDDSSGFNQARLSSFSRRFAAFIFSCFIFFCDALPFGLVASPSKFQSLNRVAVTALQRLDINTFLYLDDRLVVSRLGRPLGNGETSVENYLLFCLLIAFGGYVSMKKSMFIPSRQATFLGLNYDTEKQTVTVPAEKYHKTCKQIAEFLDGVYFNGVKYYDMKLLEKIRGKLVSWFVVVQNYSYYIKEANEALKVWERTNGRDIVGRYIRSNPYLAANQIENLTELISELEEWRALNRLRLSRKWRPGGHHNLFKTLKFDLHTDASGGGLGSCLIQRLNGQAMETRCFAVPLDLVDEPIHSKEAAILLIALASYGSQLDNSYLTFWCDNQAVCESFNKNGGRNVAISRHLRALIEHCEDHNIRLNIEWVSTTEQLADAPSRNYSLANCRIRPSLAQLIVMEFRISMDLFADPTNRLPGCQFYSRYPFPEAYGQDALTIINCEKAVIHGFNYYAYPPQALARPFVTQILPHLPRALYLHHQAVGEVDIERNLSQHCSHRILLGCRRQPCCLSPSGSRRTDSGVAYYRLYRQPLTYLYCRGFDLPLLLRFQESLRRNLAPCSQCRHPPLGSIQASQ